MKVLRFRKFHDVNMLLFCKRGRSIWYPTAQHVFFKKSYWRYCLLTQQFVIRNLISWICKRYLWVLSYNNFYANIGLALVKTTRNLKYFSTQVLREPLISQKCVFHYGTYSLAQHKSCVRLSFMIFLTKYIKIFSHMYLFINVTLTELTSAMVFVSWWILVCPRRLPSGAWM